MRVFTTITEFRAWRKSISPKTTLGFVPTMGALHEGHISLVQKSKSQAQVTVASIFVNPLQFDQKEDLTKYPRAYEKDRALLESVNTDILFFPDVSEMYKDSSSTYVTEDKLSLPLCGSFRPGHFRGVTTVVLKLLNIIQPDFLYSKFNICQTSFYKW
ncbi:MAG: pantoate--beta-alanine ligase [Deltaproteobacteria bacterium]|nr:pantoate--beta-alanine ligase [Deltaproteobacteria bacterium]